MRQSLEAISLGALVVMAWETGRALFGPDRLMDRIPTHFNLAGQPDRWGSPSTLPVLLVVALALYLLLTIVARFPSTFNYPVRVTVENRPQLEALALDLILWIKAEAVCLMAGIQWFTIEAARQGRGGLHGAFVSVYLLALFATVAWFMVAMRRAAHTKSAS
jgi:hypothetical protein